MGECDRMVTKLKTARISLGLTQAELAKSIGVSSDCVSRWERGRFPPALPDLIKWCAAVGLVLALIPMAKGLSTSGEN